MASYVYECYDSTGHLLYVGLADDVFDRIAQHYSMSWWAPQLARTRASAYPTREAAAVEERRRIESMHPRWNIRYLPPRRHWEARHYEDYALSKQMRGAKPYGESAGLRPGEVNRLRNEYRFRFGAELLIPPRGDATSPRRTHMAARESHVAS